MNNEDNFPTNVYAWRDADNDDCVLFEEELTKDLDGQIVAVYTLSKTIDVKVQTKLITKDRQSGKQVKTKK